MKSEILENLKKRKGVPVQPTGVNLPKYSLQLLSNALEHQKAHTSLEALVAPAYAPPYIHRLLLIFHLSTEFFKELKQLLILPSESKEMGMSVLSLLF